MDKRKHPTEAQFDTFEAEVNRLGVEGAQSALGHNGPQGDYELLVDAFDSLNEADAGQALRVLAIAR